MIQKKLLQRHAKDMRGHREGRSSSKQDTASPSGGGKEHERPGDSVNERNDTEQTWSQRKAGPSFQSKRQHDRCTGTKSRRRVELPKRVPLQLWVTRKADRALMADPQNCRLAAFYRLVLSIKKLID